MPPEKELTLPFLTREMLQFEHGATFGLRVRSQTNRAEMITVRGMTREGAFTFSHVTDGTGNLIEQTFAIPDMPIMVSAVDVGNVYIQGEAFVALSVTVNGDLLQELASGYVHGLHGVSWPSQTLEDPRPGGGVISVLRPANPAVATDLEIEVTNGEVWRFMALRLTLVTDANVADRRAHVRIDFGVQPLIDAYSDIDQTASLTRLYSAASFGTQPSAINDDDILIPFPSDIFLNVSMSVETEVLNLQAGDQIQDVQLLIERWQT